MLKGGIATESVKEPKDNDMGLIRILLVEDNPDHALRARVALKGNDNWAIDEARTKNDALKYLSRNKYRVILIDYCLPDGSGLDLIDWVKKDSIVMVMTGQGDEKIAVESLQKGAQDYIVKDALSYDLLSDTVRKAVERFDSRSVKSEDFNRFAHGYRDVVPGNGNSKASTENDVISGQELRTRLNLINKSLNLIRQGQMGEINGRQGRLLDSVLNNCRLLGRQIQDWGRF